MSNNFRYVFTVKDALGSMKSFPDDAILVDVDLKKGRGFFPKLTSLGKGNLEAYERDYSLVRNEHFDINEVTCLLIDISDSQKYKREFLPMTKNMKPKLPKGVLKIGDLKRELSSYNPKTIILKKEYNSGDSDVFISPSFLGHYNNETYPFVDKQGVPITAGLSNDQVATFSIFGKSNFLDAFVYKFSK